MQSAVGHCLCWRCIKWSKLLSNVSPWGISLQNTFYWWWQYWTSHHTVCLMNYVPVLFDRLYEVCENLFKSFHNLIQVKCVQEVFTPVSTAWVWLDGHTWVCRDGLDAIHLFWDSVRLSEALLPTTVEAGSPEYWDGWHDTLLALGLSAGMWGGSDQRNV